MRKEVEVCDICQNNFGHFKCEDCGNFVCKHCAVFYNLKTAFDKSIVPNITVFAVDLPVNNFYYVLCSKCAEKYTKKISSLLRKREFKHHIIKDIFDLIKNDYVISEAEK